MVIAGVVIDLDAALIALVALVILAGAIAYLRPAILAVFNNMPVIGAWIGPRIDAILATAQAQMQAWADMMTITAVNLIYRVASAFHYLHYAAAEALYQITSALQRIVTVYLPASEGRATAYAAHLYTLSTGYAQDLFRQLWGDVTTYVDGVEASLRALIASVSATAAQDAATAAGAAVAPVAASVAALGAQEAALGAQLAGIEGDVGARLAALTGQMTQAIGDAFATAEGDLSSVREGLTARINALAQDIESEISQAFAQAGTDAQALTIPLALAITAIEDSPCMQACDVLGAFGSVLSQLDTLAVLELVGAARSDPAGAAAFLSEFAAPIAKSAAQDATDLLGAA